MTEQECRDRVRCALSDRTGALSFENFDIVDAPDCSETAYNIREYLLGRPLAEVDVDSIREMGDLGNPLCARVVAGLVADCQRLFAQAERNNSSASLPTEGPAQRSLGTHSPSENLRTRRPLV